MGEEFRALVAPRLGTKAGAGVAERSVTAASYARQFKNGSVVDEWLGNGPAKYLDYARHPEDSWWRLTGNRAYWDRIDFQWTLREAVFAQVEPVKGWRLTGDGGLELFNANGAKTGQIDGEANYLSGRLATAESGERVELNGSTLAWFDSANINNTKVEKAGLELRVTAPRILLDANTITHKSDTDWARIDAGSGSSRIAALGPNISHLVSSPYDGLQARVKGGVLYVSGAIQKTSPFAANDLLFTFGTLFRPGAAAVQYAYSGGHNFILASQVNGSVVVAVATSATSMFLGLTIPL